MNRPYDGLRVAVVHWQADDGIAVSLIGALHAVGCQRVNRLMWNDVLPGDVDVILVYGPMGSLVPLGQQLLAQPLGQRPALALWMTEPLPDPRWPRRVVGSIAAGRAGGERIAYRQDTGGEWTIDPRWRWITARLHRFRYLGDLAWLRDHGILSVVAVGSRVIAEYLREWGFDPTVAYLGYTPDWGTDLSIERDVPVLWLGKVATDRRQRMLQRVRAALRRRGVDVLVVDGIEHPYVFGAARSMLLNRTRIMLNLLRYPWDNNALRFYLSVPNGAMIVSEPTLPHTPFVPGVHLITAPVDELAETVCYYLAHENERAAVAARAYALMTTELTMENGVRRVLDGVVGSDHNEA